MGISDLGFCGPADISPKSIYGNLPYVAPEVITGKDYTLKSDIYSVAMLMWEISSGQPPFSDCKHDFDFVMNIINGMRPKIVPGTPIEYQNLMEQCWDADPSKRLDSHTLAVKMQEINLHYQSIIPNESIQQTNKANNNLKSNYTISISKVHQFENLPKPKNATKGIVISDI
jgi:serine/threonine protein kinase